MEDIRRVAHCPSCETGLPKSLFMPNIYSDTAYAHQDGEEIDLPMVNYVAACEACNGILSGSWTYSGG